MRGTVAKRIRAQVFGVDGSFRDRRYYRNKQTGQLHTDDKRKIYQRLKKAHKEGTY